MAALHIGYYPVPAARRPDAADSSIETITPSAGYGVGARYNKEVLVQTKVMTII